MDDFIHGGSLINGHEPRTLVVSDPTFAEAAAMSQETKHPDAQQRRASSPNPTSTPRLIKACSGFCSDYLRL